MSYKLKELIQEQLQLLKETGEWPHGVDLKYCEEHPDEHDEFTDWIRSMKEDLENIIFGESQL